MPSAAAISTTAFAERAGEIAGTQARLRILPRWQLRLIGTGMPAVREVPEMLYEFDQGWIVDHSADTTALGDHATPLDTSLAATVSSYRARPGLSAREPAQQERNSTNPRPARKSA